MNKESKLNLNAGDYAISHCDSDKTYTGLEVHKMLCDAYIAGNNDTLESEDEKVRKEIINYFKCQSEEEPTRKEIHNKWIAWLENVPVTIDHEKREGFHLGYKACLERQTEQKPEENKGNIGEISPNWSEEDEINVYNIIHFLEEPSMLENNEPCKKIVIDWLKSLKGRVQPKPKYNFGDTELTQEELCEGLIRGMVDEHNRVTKEVLRNEYEKGRGDAIAEMQKEWSNVDKDILFRIIDDLKFLRDTISIDPKYAINIIDMEREITWLKSLRPQNRWKPSDEQMEALKYVVNLMASSESPKENDYYYNVFKDLRKQLKKLMENSYESKNCTQNS